MTEADFIIIATAIAVVGAIIVGVTEHATRRRMARTAPEQSDRDRQRRPGRAALARAALSSATLSSRPAARSLG
jgi:hypothetical protein